MALLASAWMTEILSASAFDERVAARSARVGIVGLGYAGLPLAMAFAEAAELQESDDFSSVADPPAWHYPVRRDLAEALLQEGDVTGARKEAEAALKYRPRDPGTLALLSTLERRTAAR